MDLTDLIDIHQSLFPTAAKHTFISSSYNPFPKVSHGRSQNKFKFETYQAFFLTTIEWNKKSTAEENWKIHNMWKLNNTFFKINKNENIPKLLRCSKAVQTVKFIVYLKKRCQINKELEKEHQPKPKVTKRKKMTTIIAE